MHDGEILIFLEGENEWLSSSSEWNGRQPDERARFYVRACIHFAYSTTALH